MLDLLDLLRLRFAREDCARLANSLRSQETCLICIDCANMLEISEKRADLKLIIFSKRNPAKKKKNWEIKQEIYFLHDFTEDL